MITFLRENKKAIHWTSGDIKDISLSIVLHKIHLEVNAKHYYDPQRHLNLIFEEVVRKEVFKWLDHEIIYLIFL